LFSFAGALLDRKENKQLPNTCFVHFLARLWDHSSKTNNEKQQANNFCCANIQVTNVQNLEPKGSFPDNPKTAISLVGVFHLIKPLPLPQTKNFRLKWSERDH